MLREKSASIGLFKTCATLTHDNRESAANAVSRSWGMCYWRDGWYYKEHTLQAAGRVLILRTGKVVRRHNSYTHTEMVVDGNGVSRAQFLKTFGHLLEEGIVLQPKPASPVAVETPRRAKVLMPSLFDSVNIN